jgi:hypothetical protein
MPSSLDFVVVYRRYPIKLGTKFRAILYFSYLTFPFRLCRLQARNVASSHGYLKRWVRVIWYKRMRVSSSVEINKHHFVGSKHGMDDVLVHSWCRSE